MLDLRFGWVILILFGVERFCVLYFRVLLFGIFIGYFCGIVIVWDCCVNVDWIVKILRIIGIKLKFNLLS